MLDYDDLCIGTRDIELEWAGSTLRFAYAPGKYSNDLQAKFNRTMKLDDGDSRKVGMNDTMLLQLLESWEIGRDGQAVPIDEPHMSKLPIPLKGQMVSAIIEDMGMNDGPKSRSGSRNGSLALVGRSGRPPSTESSD